MEKKRWFYVVAIIFFLFAAILLFKGYDKLNNYKNSDSYYSTSVNAYVGGDAYNYIINGTHATAYNILAIGDLLAGILLICTGVLYNQSVEKYELKYKSKKDIEEEVLPPL